MTEPEARRPAPPSGGGMTQATGWLTPDDAEQSEFVPGELRAIEDPGLAHSVTVGARRRNVADSPAADRPGQLDERALESLAPNERDGGYGSEHGLARGDPAYDFEERPGELERPVQGVDRPTRLGGDEAHPPEEEHF